jgi:hypothetical protein
MHWCLQKNRNGTYHFPKYSKAIKWWLGNFNSFAKQKTRKKPNPQPAKLSISELQSAWMSTSTEM